MEPGGLLLCSQGSVTGPFAESDEFSGQLPPPRQRIMPLMLVSFAASQLNEGPEIKGNSAGKLYAFCRHC